MYKPNYNVIELLCVTRVETIHKKEDIYGYMDVDDIMDTLEPTEQLDIPEIPEILKTPYKNHEDHIDNLDYEDKDENENDAENDAENDVEKNPEKEDFCNNEIIYKVQIIIRVQKTIKDIFDNFDMYPSCVAYDGSKVIFNQHSYIAYKYMVNIIDREKSRHERFNYRVLKYYKYGFSVGINKSYLSKYVLESLGDRVPNSFKIDKCKFMTKYTGTPIEDMGYYPIVEFKIMKRDEVTNEDKKMEEISYSESLYKSLDLDGNIEDLYEYIKTDNINYCFLKGPIENKEDVLDVLDPSKMEFLISTRIPEYDFYDHRRIEVN